MVRRSKSIQGTVIRYLAGATDEKKVVVSYFLFSATLKGEDTGRPIYGSPGCCRKGCRVLSLPNTITKQAELLFGVLTSFGRSGLDKTYLMHKARGDLGIKWERELDHLVLLVASVKE